jgi:hypothetical protein
MSTVILLTLLGIGCGLNEMLYGKQHSAECAVRNVIPKKYWR